MLPLLTISREDVRSREGGLSLEDRTKLVELLIEAGAAGEALRDDELDGACEASGPGRGPANARAACRISRKS